MQSVTRSPAFHLQVLLSIFSHFHHHHRVHLTKGVYTTAITSSLNVCHLICPYPQINFSILQPEWSFQRACSDYVTRPSLIPMTKAMHCLHFAQKIEIKLCHMLCRALYLSRFVPQLASSPRSHSSHTGFLAVSQHTMLSAIRDWAHALISL